MLLKDDFSEEPKDDAANSSDSDICVLRCIRSISQANSTPRIIFAGTSVAVLTYIGFDAVSTLSEEVGNPRRNILLATVLICLITGLLSGLEVYAA